MKKEYKTLTASSPGQGTEEIEWCCSRVVRCRHFAGSRHSLHGKAAPEHPGSWSKSS